MAKIEYFCVGVMNDTYDWKTTYDPYGHTKQVMKKLEDYAVKIGENNLEGK